MRHLRGVVAIGIVAVAASFGCSAIIGTRDIFFEEGAEGGTSSSSSSTGGTSSSSGDSGGDGGNDAAQCNADLQTDKANCGRCGRSCLGGNCIMGKCEPIPLATGLDNPTSAVIEGNRLIVTLYGKGDIISVPKDAPGAPTNIVTGRTSPWGAFVDNATLYFADADYEYNGVDADRRGGIWKCPLANCATPELVVAADSPLNPVLVNGVIYFAEEGNDVVSKVPLAGGAKTVLDSTTNPHGIALDATHLYYTATEDSFWRVPLSPPDAGGQAVGPQGYYTVGSVALDNDRYFYTYTDINNQAKGAGHVLSFTKAAPGQGRVDYGTDNVTPRGIVVDDQYVYWANSGTFDETAGAPTHFDGEIRACPKAGCPASGPIVLASGLGRPWEMNSDATALYVCIYGNYGQQSGAVLKIPKL